MADEDGSIAAELSSSKRGAAGRRGRVMRLVTVGTVILALGIAVSATHDSTAVSGVDEIAADRSTAGPSAGNGSDCAPDYVRHSGSPGGAESFAPGAYQERSEIATFSYRSSRSAALPITTDYLRRLSFWLVIKVDDLSSTARVVAQMHNNTTCLIRFPKGLLVSALLRLYQPAVPTQSPDWFGISVVFGDETVRELRPERSIEVQGELRLSEPGDYTVYGLINTEVRSPAS